MIHYVYRLTDLNAQGELKHYIGKRSSSFVDIGIKYFTSSKVLKKYFRDNVKHFKIKIVRQFDTASDALYFEKRYLTRVNASKSIYFFNRCNSGSKGGYDNSGLVHTILKDRDIHVTVSCDEFHKNKDKYRHDRYGRGVFKNESNEYVYCACEDAKLHGLKGVNYGIVFTRDINGNKVRVDKQYYHSHKSEFKFRDDVVAVFNTVTGENKRVTREEFKNNSNLKGIYAKYQREYKRCPYCNDNISVQNYERHVSTHKKYCFVSDGYNIFKCREDVYLLHLKDKYTRIDRKHKSDAYPLVPLYGELKHIRYVSRVRKNCYIGKEYED